MQPKLPLGMKTLYYECVNPECYYVGALVDFEDVVWRDCWNSEIGDLDLVPHCASCGEPVIFWEDVGG